MKAHFLLVGLMLGAAIIGTATAPVSLTIDGVDVYWPGDVRETV